MPLTKEQRATILETLKEHGTYVVAAKKALCTVAELRKERLQSPKFARQCLEALAIGKTTVGDNALTIIQGIAYDKNESTKNRLTAALSLANAFVPGFKGIDQKQIQHQHQIEVVTGIPRPDYSVIDGEYSEVKQLAPVDEARAKKASYMREYRRKKRDERQLQLSQNKLSPLSIQAEEHPLHK